MIFQFISFVTASKISYSDKRSSIIFHLHLTHNLKKWTPIKVIYNLANYLFKQMSFGDTALYKKSRKREDSNYRGLMCDFF